MIWTLEGKVSHSWSTQLLSPYRTSKACGTVQSLNQPLINVPCSVHPEPEYYRLCMGSSQAAKQNQTMHGELPGIWPSVLSLLALEFLSFSLPLNKFSPVIQSVNFLLPSPHHDFSLHSRILIQQAICDFFFSFTVNSIPFHILDLRHLSRSLPLSTALLRYDLPITTFSLLKCTFQSFSVVFRQCRIVQLSPLYKSKMFSLAPKEEPTPTSHHTPSPVP